MSLALVLTLSVMGDTPGNLYRCEKKEFGEKAIRNCLEMRDMLIDGFGGAIRKLLNPGKRASVITKPESHEIDAAGGRLLREVLEPLGWVVNAVQRDYGIDYNVQVFDGGSPTGTWFHVQLKSSASSEYSADRSFVSQDVTVDHARHYAPETRAPVLVIHADVTEKHVYWYAPQLARQLTTVLTQTKAQSTTFRIPTRHKIPETAPELLTAIENIHLVLATRERTSTPTRTFADNLKQLPDQEKLYRAFQEKGEALDGDYQGDPIWQIIQNMATTLGIDITDENSLLVRGLRIAARDDSPERILKNCAHLVVSLGATGPTARKIRMLFNISTAGSKVVHCTLHNFHVEGRDQDIAYAEFKGAYCDSCPDCKPRPDGWRYVGDVRRQIEDRNREFVARLTGTHYGFRYTNQD